MRGEIVLAIVVDSGTSSWLPGDTVKLAGRLARELMFLTFYLVIARIGAAGPPGQRRAVFALAS
jgi:hypothetical protein